MAAAYGYVLYILNKINKPLDVIFLIRQPIFDWFVF